MKVGITQKVIINNHGVRVDSLEQSYINYYSGFCITLVPIPNTLQNVGNYLEEMGIERLIISGGGEIDSKLYDGSLQKGIIYQEERDRTETELLKYAIDNKIPVFAECRGAQFVNVFFGGSLIQNIKDNILNPVDHVGTRHKINIIDEKFIKLFPANLIEVNSFHQHGFTKNELSDEFRVFATAEDGIIEGFYHPQFSIVCVMWHPERMASDGQDVAKKFIENFINN